MFQDRTRSHHIVGGGYAGERARHFSSPKIPNVTPATEPPSRSDAEKKAMEQREAARMARGKRSTIIAGGQPSETLGSSDATNTNLGGTGTVLGGGQY